MPRRFITLRRPSQEARERLLPAFPEFNRDRITGASDVVVFTVPKTLTEAHLRRVLDKEESDDASPMQK